ncbi:hypothetical protein GE21DRAFT_9933 [Neurospora crassa]|uniref:Uncharacterized protein n=1 Tax=Neurospora crassa (strain ATCC 24698 / 74-OR23-1A / CBS 708.71 / DSM 1257 / FGSC 987) TaxID=367110 RepID=Q7S0S6_NEUCR|nr:hypothetical protein NCU09421 [Neurospora crassa OR74A]EAA28925.1 hypothetical protein NCU09421 [Neurospora crassa OR74A]KHE85658.1 hypothetical protein GE21DRAFT_9933 [Neurospora crassa]|eukprot:XP_958161.1 hypothetical protein NCU09421 [Neurospora crassa OR74A]
MTFTLTNTILSLVSLFISLTSAAPIAGGFGGFGRNAVAGGFGGFGRSAVAGGFGGFGRNAVGGGFGVGFNAAPYGFGFNRAFNNFAAYPYGYGLGFNRINAFPYGMGFGRVNSVDPPPMIKAEGGCSECIKEAPVYVNNVPPPPEPNPAPIIYNEIPAAKPSPPPMVINDIQSPPPQAPPTIMNNVIPNMEPNVPPTVINNRPPAPEKPMPPMVVNNNVAEDCECDDCGCNPAAAELVQQDVEYVEQPAVAYMPVGSSSVVENVVNDGVAYGGQSIVYP